MIARVLTAIAALGFLSGAALAQAKLTDPQIAHIAYTAGQLDIEAAKQALAKSKNKEVRAFADDMVRDHTAVNKQALALVKKLKVTPQDNATSQALTKQAAAKRAELARLKGAAFDRPMSTTKSPTTRPSTARWRPSSFRRRAMPNSKACCRPA